MNISTIRKIVLTVTILIALFCLFCISAHAQKFDGYIIKLKETPAVSLMTACTDADYIDDTLYKVDSMEDAYLMFGKENIEGFFPDYEMQLFDYPQTTSDEHFDKQWHLGAVNSELARQKGLTGKGVKIAVIDSGVDKSHPDFDDVTFATGYNCVEGATDVNDVTDILGHGTTVTGVIAAATDNDMGVAGLADGVTIIPIKITETSSFGVSAILKGMKKALETDCDIINMSLGGPVSNSLQLKTFQEYIDTAEEKGIIVVSAAGNSGHGNNVVNYPAAFDTVIGVGAVGSDFAVTYFSQKNKGVFVTAPGMAIVTLSTNNAIVSTSGTSLSSPIVTACLALIKEVCPDYTGADMRELVRSTAVDRGDSGYDYSYGYGMISLFNMISEVENAIPDFIITEGKKSTKKRMYIHNNTDDVVDSYLILGGTPTGAKPITLNPGVTTKEYGNMSGKVLLWAHNLKPLVAKYKLQS